MKNITTNNKTQKLNISPFPNKIMIDINKTCNLKCKMCFLHTRNNDQLPIEKIQEILTEISKFNNVCISYSSMEVFKRKDFLDITDLTYKLKIPYTILTNGTLVTKPIIQKLLKSPPESITFSVHWTEKIHSLITGVPESYKKTLFALSTLKKERDSINQKLPYIKITYSITEINYEYLIPFLKSVKKNNIDVRVHHLMWKHNKSYIKSKKFYEKVFWITEKPQSIINFENKLSDWINVDKLKKIISEAKKTYNILEGPILKSSQIKPWYKNDIYFRKKQCTFPFQSVCIRPNWDVTPCQFINNYIYWNVKDNTLYEIWNSEKANKFREKLAQYGKLPLCTRCIKL